MIQDSFFGIELLESSSPEILPECASGKQTKDATRTTAMDLSAGTETHAYRLLKCRTDIEMSQQSLSLARISL